MRLSRMCFIRWNGIHTLLNIQYEGKSTDITYNIILNASEKSVEEWGEKKAERFYCCLNRAHFTIPTRCRLWSSRRVHALFSLWLLCNIHRCILYSVYICVQLINGKSRGMVNEAHSQHFQPSDMLNANEMQSQIDTHVMPKCHTKQYSRSSL